MTLIKRNIFSVNEEVKIKFEIGRRSKPTFMEIYIYIFMKMGKKSNQNQAHYPVLMGVSTRLE